MPIFQWNPVFPVNPTLLKAIGDILAVHLIVPDMVKISALLVVYMLPILNAGRQHIKSKDT
ncbi:hypothetical protein XNC1_1175 [Xenorhabdus nematophila ATCC 19061]|uniref:Uncharacterized protein n=1 Tax=Xenorhabdus nematophila (strain ATCC 19061 / DSM 3370 / CCUG 14189 / LMG 1036 / NCIMB 9965 / AN6) TaxID=406817 RepID=D3V9K8_XENNA|nr:hypothetical protein XNC1_1175 [Xenorhabdus nematophila ATCC 19061]